jgi:Penicillin-insensitive murein endopeptidase
VRVAAIVVVLVGLGVLGVVGAGSLAQVPPPDPPPPVTTGPPGPATTSPEPPAATPAATAPATPAPAGPSRAFGQPWHGRLVNGVELPEVSADWLTWDPVLKQIPNRPERRWGTAKLVATLRRVLASWHAAHPEMPQVLVGDMSRPQGGVFDQRYGGLGHASHQNGLDADVYYPRADHRLLAAYKPSLVDRALAQDLLNRFVAAGAQFVFVGTRVGLTGPKKVVQVLAHHNDHMHVRIFPPRG